MSGSMETVRLKADAGEVFRLYLAREVSPAASGNRCLESLSDMQMPGNACLSLTESVVLAKITASAAAARILDFLVPRRNCR